ncbi:hypothetical protein V6N11_041533 [Hibiscus sabdariffa]|uniref:CASP-like protein n=1 Tax=Hibiscus sabdariffa TaxID=183260 RepID=A0ABR2RKQ8_9ROSI
MGKLVCSEICEDEGSVLDTKSLLMILHQRQSRLPKKRQQPCSPFLDINLKESLFYAIGAAMAVGILGDVQWMKVCNLFGGICHRMTASIILCLPSVFFWHLSLLDLHKIW